MHERYYGSHEAQHALWRGKREKTGGLPHPEVTWMSGRSSRGSGGTQGTERQCGGHRGGCGGG